MSNIIAKILKLILSALVFACAFMCVFVTPDFEEVETVVSFNSSYNLIPYVENEYVSNNENNNDSNTTNNVNIKEVSVVDKYIGTITAYGPDCVGCSGITASGYKVAENNNGIITSLTTTYYDNEYGNLRVLAASTNFPFGTVIRISGSRISDYIMGIVLDRGGAMNNAQKEGKVLIDLLFETEKSNEVYEFGRQENVTFEVLRYGY